MNRNSVLEEENEEIENDIELVIEDEELGRKVSPFFSGFGIPLDKRIIFLILWEIRKLHNYVNQGIKPFFSQYNNIMTFKNWNNGDINVVVIPRYKTEASFNSVNRNQNPFLDNLPRYIVGIDMELEVNEAVGWIIKRLNFRYEDIFNGNIEKYGVSNYNSLHG